MIISIELNTNLFTPTVNPRFAIIILICSRNFKPDLNVNDIYSHMEYLNCKKCVSSTGNLRIDCFAIFYEHEYL